MEELRSTEILDKEIQADAHKKAENILKKNAASCEDILNSLDKNLEAAKKLKADLYNKKYTAFKKNKEASVPLEKQRIEVSFVQNAISENINKYLKTLSEDERINLVLKELEKQSSAAESGLNAYVYGFDLKKVQGVLAKKLGKKLLKCEKTDFGRISVEDDNVAEKEGIILESEDKSVKMRLTMSELIGRLTETYRQQLCDALFGKGGLA